ncbi:MAG: hypothetical protein HS115_19980 [Spirochaetales bacterium]|nr:hypothetical protein [Spirochaetales bacterium]
MELLLPHSYHGPLHILPPLLEQIVTLMFFGLLFLIALFTGLYFYLNRRRPQVKKEEVNSTDWLLQLQEQTQKHGDYRQGCHDLSRLLKETLEKSTGMQIEEMTAREIEKHLVSGGFFLELCHWQFGSLTPDRESFRQLIQRARKVVQAKRQKQAHHA